MEQTTITPLSTNTQPLSPQIPPRKSHKKRNILAVLIIALLAVVGVGAYALLSNKDKDSQNDNAVGNNTKVQPSVTFYYRDGTTVLTEDIIANEPAPSTHSFFVSAVTDELKEKYGETYYDQGAWQIITTLDKDMQATSEQAIKDSSGQFSKQNVDKGGTITQDATNSHVLAWVGAIDNKLDQDFLSEPVMMGGLIKPFVYTTAIDSGTSYGAGSKVSDTQRQLEGYPCTSTAPTTGNCLQNYDRRYAGDVSLRYALGGLRNVPAADIASQVGIAKVLQQFSTISGGNEPACYMDFERTEKTQCYLAASLGDGLYASPRNIISAYATLSNGGQQKPQTLILKTLLNGEVKDSWDSSVSTQPLKDETAYIINDILSDPRASYYTDKTIFTLGNTPVSYIHGITNDSTSTHVVTYTPKYVVGFWTAQDKQTITGFGETFTVPVSLTILDAAEKQSPSQPRTKPSALQTLPAHVTTSHVGVGSMEPSPSTDLFPSWYKAQ